jgi:hypothetical protein
MLDEPLSVSVAGRRIEAPTLDSLSRAVAESADLVKHNHLAL